MRSPVSLRNKTQYYLNTNGSANILRNRLLITRNYEGSEQLRVLSGGGNSYEIQSRSERTGSEKPSILHQPYLAGCIKPCQVADPCSSDRTDRRIHQYTFCKSTKVCHHLSNRTLLGILPASCCWSDHCISLSETRPG